MNVNFESISILRAIKKGGEKVLKPVEALGKEIEKLKEKRAEMKAKANAAREKHGAERPEYSQFSTELKTMLPEIEKGRLFYVKAVDEFLNVTFGGSALFEKHIWPLLNIHYNQYKSELASSLRHLVDGDYTAERMASEKKSLQAFL